MKTSDAIVFLGPSMPLEDARRLLDADYRSPVCRGDLEALPPGTPVAIIDGVFEQDLAVSLREVHEAVSRGVVLFGGASMGALRAAEVPGVIGVGRVFEWYRDGVIQRDDEVAVLFDESSGRALTVPAVNLRFAVERLSRLGTIDPSTAASLLSAALKMPFKERTYPSILEAAGLYGRIDSADLIAMLQAHDLKYRDAQAVLEALDSHLQSPQPRPAPRAASVVPLNGYQSESLLPIQNSAADHALIWESGDRVTHAELIEFLAYTGQLESRARALHAHFAALNESGKVTAPAADAQQLFNSAARQWGWMSSEEAKTTLADLGLDIRSLDARCQERVQASARAAHLLREGSAEFLHALLAEFFLDHIALKREVMRLGSLRALARQVAEEPNPQNLHQAEQVLLKANGEFSMDAVRKRWARLGFTSQPAQQAFVTELARARRAARQLVRAENGPQATAAPAPLPAEELPLRPCPKPAGESRFCLPPAAAEAHARRISQLIGVTRISMIGELGDLAGIQVAQAARPGNAWSSSYGSGKSRTSAGAIVGSIMEETEKWAQEQFRPQELVVGSYAELAPTGQFVDPATLDLPYDSVYRAGMQLHWYPCFDLLSRRKLYVPVDLLDMRSRKHDICFTRRGARKHLATNGLGSGFSREEAILHGLCEYVERHAQRLAELLLCNPGGLGPHHYRFVDLTTAPATLQDLANRLETRGATVRLLDITCEIRIPTFFATITRELQRADGYGTHPDPATAMEMALLEAAQTIASATAGGREDLSIHARSLGRHERPRPVSVQDAWFWLDPDPELKTLADLTGFTSSDVCSDVQWCLDRLRAAGLQHALVADLTPAGIEPASVVRVIVPGLETNNPFYTGLRARLLLLRDLLPKWR